MIEILVFGLVILAVICLWVLIDSRKSPKFLIWFIPLLLVLVTSTYVTYTSILGYPRMGTPNKSVYLTHYIDEPDWIYLWVLTEDNIPMSYQIVYTREDHENLEGVEGEVEKGKFMVIGEEAEWGVESSENSDKEGGGYTVGGDISIFEWNYEQSTYKKD